MMFKSLVQAAAVAALIVAGAVGTTAATTTAASAGEARFGIIIGDSYPHVRHYRHWRACSPGHALHKARRLGIHRAYVSRVGRNRIVVRGHRHGHRQRAVFANAPRCPVIAYRR